MKRLVLAAAAAVFLPFGMASLAEAGVRPGLEQSPQILPVQAHDPALHERRNGRLEVIFRSGCRMIFNRAGKAIDAQHCSRAQEGRAHDAVAAHLRRHGRPVGRPGPGPRINELRNGRLQVVFRSGCIMIFNRRGQAVDAQRCSRAQEGRGHDAVSAYMRRHRRPVGPSGGGPRINELRNGRLQVVFHSGCRMIFNRRGQAVDAQRCSRAQEGRAHDAVSAYMRRHGRRGRGPHIVEHRNGSLDVVFSSGCRVRFNRRGRAVDAQYCSRAQEDRARAMAAEYRRARR
ncbi:MAG: hypothetical protein OEO83_16590 [Alphaproteobacteria bacterium]|nr:hypothetical protein [Alphaproteobacteria bacterium]